MAALTGLGLVLALLPALALAAPGDLDPGFGSGGTVVSTTVVSSVTGLGVQPDGRIVVAAARPAPNDTTDMVLVRFGADGMPDPSFGSGGMVTDGGGIYFAPALFVEGDGSLVVGGTRCDATQCIGTVRRYDADGRPDPSFTPIERFVDAPTYVEVIVAQEDGKLVIGGNAGHAPGFVVWLARYGADGAPDPSFGANGLTSKVVSPHGASLGSLVIAPGGSFVAAVSGGTSEGVFSSLVEFTESGVEQGRAGTPFSYPRLSLTGDGGIVAAGTFTSPDHPTPTIGLGRFTMDLQPDSAFAGGQAIEGPAGSPGDVLVTPEKHVVVAATLGEPGAYHFALLRWTASGELDRSFGQDGVAVALPGHVGSAERVLRLPDGKLLAAGMVDQPPSGPLVLARFESDGGSTTTTIPGGSATTTLPSACGADAAACDDGDACTDDRCDGGRCIHQALTGLDGVVCLCAAAMPACSKPSMSRRVERACGLVTRAEAASAARARRLLRRAVQSLHKPGGRSVGASCDDLLRRAAELRRRTADLLVAFD